MVLSGPSAVVERSLRVAIPWRMVCPQSFVLVFLICSRTANKIHPLFTLSSPSVSITKTESNLTLIIFTIHYQTFVNLEERMRYHKLDINTSRFLFPFNFPLNVPVASKPE